MKFQVKITGWGADALEFLNPTCNFIIIFNEDAPPELADISVLHTKFHHLLLNDTYRSIL